MRSFHLITGAAVAAAVVVATAVPAFAHAEFAGTTRLPSGTSQRLTLDVPEEKGDAIRTTVVRVQVPTGWDATACENPAGWTCSITPDASGKAVVGFNRAGGTDPVERFVFTVTVGPVGKAAFPVNQTYDNGDTVRWIGAAGSAEPAPVLEAIAGPPTTAAPATTAAPVATTAAPAVTTAAPTAATATAVATPTTVPASTAAPTSAAGPTSAAVTGASTTAHGATGEATTTTTTTTIAATSTKSAKDKGSGSGGAIGAVTIALIAAAGAGAYLAKVRRSR